MAKYVYPAVFTKEDDGGYSVLFPDIEGCYTDGDDMPGALEMAEDALCLMLYDMEEERKEIPPPSDSKTIKADKNSVVSLICCDTIEYRRFYDTKAVKKTLSIPAWLNNQAEKANAPFSQILQQGLKEYLHLAE
ncbi:MAG: type II toxin-antitoxin system HicB family antitoxin [Oscillospiraceae bacterium]|nr:type II toxin-antitoxin system HicB family antitoxin [Oscillospiraceae bacterium]